MNFRSDLAVERREYVEKEKLDGVISKEENINGVSVDTIEIINEKGEQLLKKPQGKYITVDISSYMRCPDTENECVRIITDSLRNLLCEKESVLVAGLGNSQITPDALGPGCIDLLLATRHIDKELQNALGLQNLRSVSGISPGVLGKTGIETAEIIDAVVKKTKPSAVICIDALAARKLERLGNTVQMCNTGISPGSGVGNRRNEISEKTLGVPVISIGVPTVVDGLTMALDFLEKQNIDTEFLEKNFNEGKNVMVTPKEIDLVTEKACRLISLCINLALQDNLGAEDILSLVG